MYFLSRLNDSNNFVDGLDIALSPIQLDINERDVSVAQENSSISIFPALDAGLGHMDSVLSMFLSDAFEQVDSALRAQSLADAQEGGTVGCCACASCGEDAGMKQVDGVFSVGQLFEAAQALNLDLPILNLPSIFSLDASYGEGASSIDLSDYYYNLYTGEIHRNKDDGALFGGPGGDTIAGDSSTTATITVGGTATGYRNSGTDDDWFAIDLTAGNTYNFFLIRDGNAATPHEDPELDLYDIDGLTQLMTDDDGGAGRNSLITFSATTTGTYYLNAQGWDTTTGQYVLYAFEQGVVRPDRDIDGIVTYLVDEFANAEAWTDLTITYNISGLVAAGQTLARLAFQDWEDVSGLTFTEVMTGGQIVFDDNQAGAFASTTSAGGVITGATINVEEAWTASYDVNDYRYQTYLHEIGHALGLGHGGPYNGSSNYNISNIYGNDAWNFTVMSYHDQNEASSGTARLVLGPQVADIAAVQDMYGAGTVRGGDTVYGFNTTETGSIYDFAMWEATSGGPTRPPSFAIYDTGGIDTFDLSVYGTNQVISLVASDVDVVFSDVGDNYNTGGDLTDPLFNLVSIARNVIIENAIGGSGDDMITGNDANNELEGNAGDDIIDGGAGTDYAIYNGTAAQYTVTDNMDGTWTVAGNGEGSDTVSNVEFARFTDGDVALAPGGGPTFTEGDDNEVGTSGDDVLDALGGNDIVDGLAGNDVINGGSGNDTLTGSAGMDTLNGDADNDTLIGGAGADALNGGTGTDWADYRTASSAIAFNVVTGGTLGDALGDTYSGIERYWLSDFDDVVTGSSANEYFYGEDGADTINAGDGADRVYGGNGDDTQNGDGGNDTLYGSAGSDALNGGAGSDTASYFSASSGVTLNAATGGTVGDAAGDTYTGIEIYTGSAHVDSITGDNLANDLRGGGGDDMLDGGSGNDRLHGQAGADTLIGGGGTDAAYYTTAGSGITMNLATGGTVGDANGDTYSGIENVFGSLHNDNITGDSGINALFGVNGDDTVNGEGGNDLVYGQNGMDILNGGTGNDRLYGGADNDTLNGDDGVDTLYGEAGDDTMSGGLGADFLIGGAGSDSHDGGDGSDTVTYFPSGGAVTVNLTTGGTAGDAAGDTYTSIERVFGSGFDDNITGSANVDTLFGMTGDDYLTSGAGADRMFGGLGTDSFGYDTGSDGIDRIMDFNATTELVYILGGDVNFDTFAEVMAVGTDIGADVRFNFGGSNFLTLVGTQLADLTAANFDFSNSPPAGERPDDKDLESFSSESLDEGGDLVTNNEALLDNLPELSNSEADLMSAQAEKAYYSEMSYYGMSDWLA